MFFLKERLCPTPCVSTPRRSLLMASAVHFDDCSLSLNCCRLDDVNQPASGAVSLIHRNQSTQQKTRTPYGENRVSRVSPLRTALVLVPVRNLRDGLGRQDMFLDGCPVLAILLHPQHEQTVLCCRKPQPAVPTLPSIPELAWATVQKKKC